VGLKRGIHGHCAHSRRGVVQKCSLKAGIGLRRGCSAPHQILIAKVQFLNRGAGPSTLRSLGERVVSGSARGGTTVKSLLLRFT
jgi:hypothetical protein